MTKEEKIKKAAVQYEREKFRNDTGEFISIEKERQNGFIIGATSEASQEYWQRYAIEFADWIVNSNYKTHPKRKLWYFDNPADLDIPTYMTTSELYQLYKDQNNLNNTRK